MDKTEVAREALTAIARANFGDRAGFGSMVRQSADNVEALRYGVAGWFLRPLYVSPSLVFIEGRIWDAARFVGCPNPPDCYLVKRGDRVQRFRDYGRALRCCAIEAIREFKGA